VRLRANQEARKAPRVMRSFQLLHLDIVKSVFACAGYERRASMRDSFARPGSVRIDLVSEACIDHVRPDSPDGDSGAAFAIVRAANLRRNAIAAVFCRDHSGQSECRSATIRPRSQPSFARTAPPTAVRMGGSQGLPAQARGPHRHLKVP
jgi:hypothetical protein